MDDSTFTSVLAALSGHSMLDFIYSSALDEPAKQIFVAEVPKLLHLFFSREETRVTAFNTAFGVCTRLLMGVACLSSKTYGWHFGVKTATSQQIEAFSIEEMAGKLAADAPYCWNLLGFLLASDPTQEGLQAQYLMAAQAATQIQYLGWWTM